MVFIRIFSRFHADDLKSRLSRRPLLPCSPHCSPVLVWIKGEPVQIKGGSSLQLSHGHSRPHIPDNILRPPTSLLHCRDTHSPTYVPHTDNILQRASLHVCTCQLLVQANNAAHTRSRVCYVNHMMCTGVCYSYYILCSPLSSPPCPPICVFCYATFVLLAFVPCFFLPSSLILTCTCSPHFLVGSNRSVERVYSCERVQRRPSVYANEACAWVGTAVSATSAVAGSATCFDTVAARLRLI